MGTKSGAKKPEPCPCGADASYGDCCGRYLDGGRHPDTAAQLMHSRYTAYVFGRSDYLLRTWHRSTRPDVLDLQTAPAGRWLGLDVLGTEGGGLDDSEGTVEFVARYKPSGKAQRLHERSRFVREDGQWFYVNGDILS